MSQERTRFPIQPQDRHRTAGSFDDVSNEPEQLSGDAGDVPGIPHPSDAPDQDKPDVPPHDRHDR